MPIGGRISGGGGGAAPAADLWDVVYEADLTAQSDSGTLNNGATVPIEGANWSVQSGADSDYCSGFEINSSGLQITIDNASLDSIQSGSTTTVPRLEVPISSLVSSIDSDDTIAFQVLLSSSGMADNWVTQGLTVIDAASKWVANRTLYYTGYTSGNVGNDVMKGDGERISNLANYGTAGSEPGLRETVWHCGSSSFVLGSNISGTLVDPLNCTSFEVATTVDSAGGVTNITEDPTLAIDPDTAKLQLIAAHEDESEPLPATWTATFTRVRVLKRKK